MAGTKRKIEEAARHRRRPLQHPENSLQRFLRNGGAEGIRTLDLLDAIEARFQLRHGPTGGMNFYNIRLR